MKRVLEMVRARAGAIKEKGTGKILVTASELGGWKLRVLRVCFSGGVLFDLCT